jgi:hypothetical protein
METSLKQTETYFMLLVISLIMMAGGVLAAQEGTLDSKRFSQEEIRSDIRYLMRL